MTCTGFLARVLSTQWANNQNGTADDRTYAYDSAVSDDANGNTLPNGQVA